MRHFHRTIVYCTTIIAGMFLLSGCLGTSKTQFNSSIQFGFRLAAGQNLYTIDSMIVSGTDKLKIKRVRFIFGGDSVTVNDTTLAVIKDKSKWGSVSIPRRTGYNPNQSVISLFPSGIIGSYDTFIFSIQKAPDSGAGIDPEFTSNSHHYSMIIEGTYNGGKFTYKSDKTFTKPFPLGIDLPQYNVKYAFIVSANVLSWFSKNPGGSGGFYNPAKANTSDSLDSLFSKRIKHSLRLVTRSNQTAF